MLDPHYYFLKVDDNLSQTLLALFNVEPVGHVRQTDAPDESHVKQLRLHRLHVDPVI